MINLEQLKKNAIEELNFALEQKRSGSDPWRGDEDSMTHEIADSNVPAYNSTLLEIAAESPEVGLEEPGTGECLSPASAAAYNIYQVLVQHLRQHLHSLSETKEGN